MVRAIMAGAKTQTRRIAKPQKPHQWQVSDRLWVRETWADVNTENGPAIMFRAGGFHFCADDAFPVEYDRYPGLRFTMWCSDLERGEPGHAWRSSIFMPRWASRITLEVTGVRVEQLQDIKERDAEAEGVLPILVPPDGGSAPHVEGFRAVWANIHGPESWDANPWVAVVQFRVMPQ
jgi:hypothetical protein